MDGYAEVEDVKSVMQDDFRGSTPTEQQAADAIAGLTEYLRRETRHHWYEPSGEADLVPTSPRSVTNIRRDVPSSPHTQDRQIYRDESGIRYPVTQAGRYSRIPLKHPGVETIDTLQVRQRDGSVEDWVAASDKQEGRGEDYYALSEGDEFEQSYLYVRASSLGPRTDYNDLLTVDYSHGVEINGTVRRGVAALAAADLTMDDNVQQAIPDDGNLIQVETKADRYVNQAMRVLGPFFQTPI